MTTTLEEIRKKLLESEKRSNFSNTSGESYPFWNIPEGSTATLRFLPDGDQSNTFFWVERLIIRLPFEGVKGKSDGPVIVNVPCVQMFGKTCPIISEVSQWFKDPSLEATGRKYWKKRSYIFQGFVVSDPMDEKDKPENPIRRFVINRSIFEIVKASLMDTEMEEIPTDYTAGRDFKLTKTKRGKYADYTTSSWSMRTRALSETELEAIQTYGLFDLKDFLPREPNAKELSVIEDMFKASVNGEAYDEGRWGNFFRPFGLAAPTSGAVAETDEVVTPSEEETVDVVESNPPSSTPKPTDALARLKTQIKTESSEVKPAAAAGDKGSDKPDPSAILKLIRERRQTS